MVRKQNIKKCDFFDFRMIVMCFGAVLFGRLEELLWQKM